MDDLPGGLLTFLFTDIEGSTPRWEARPDEMRRVMQIHNLLLEQAIAGHDGIVFTHTGDGVGAVFTAPTRAAEAAIAIQRSLQDDDWGGDERLKVRIGLNVGEAEPLDGDYLGSAVNRAARIMDVANGDQIVLSGVLGELLSGFELHPQGDHQLRGLGTERLLRLTAPDLVVDDRPLRSRVGSSTAGLPVPLHDIIGRDEELDEIRKLVIDHQVVTIVGPGGVGKTRLAIEAARSLASEYPEGVVMCDLALVGDDESVADAIAEALGARLQPGLGLVESIVQFLENRQVLLVLDGCEHVSASVQDLVARLRQIAGPSVVATSRESLGVGGEQLYGLGPLDPGSAGAALFVARAEERDAHFSPGPEEAELIREICEKVDGVPLAIELSAAWVRVLSLRQLVDQLEDRFRILRGGHRGGRFETLRDTIRWSYEQLDQREAALFTRLSVFSGGFSLDALVDVCADDLIPAADVLDVVMALVDKSMVTSERGRGVIRFRVLATIRQFAQEELDATGASREFRDRHAAYFARLVKSHAEDLLTSREAEIWDLFDGEWANIRTALDTMLDAGGVDEAADLVLAVGWYCVFAMRFEGFAWTSEVWSTLPDGHPRTAAMLGMRAMGAYFTVDDRAVALAEEGLSVDPVDAPGYCRASLAAVYLNNVHAAEDSAALTESWLEHEGQGGLANLLWAEGFRTFHLCTHEPTPEAAEHADRLAEIADGSGSATARALAKWAEGLVVALGDRDQAMEIWDEGLDAARSLNSRHLLVHLLVGLQLHFGAGRGELVEMLGRCRDTLRTALDQHYLVGTSHLFGVTAIVLARAGRAEVGARLLGAMEAAGHVPRENAVRSLTRSLGDRMATSVARGGNLSINDAAVLAIEELGEAIEQAS